MQNNNTALIFSQLREVPPAIWSLGFVSLLMDVSSEIIHALLQAYLVTVLGASMLALASSEGTASITKVFSGAFSDRLGKRKLLTVMGYGLAAVTKPIFPVASSVSWLTVLEKVSGEPHGTHW
jgi:MFS family permease